MGLMKNEFFVKRKYWLLALIGLLVLFSVFSVIAYQNLSTPKYVERKENIMLYSWQSWYNYSATVEKENPLWPVGMRLNEQTVYFPAVASNLIGKFHFQISSAEIPSGPTELTTNYQLKRILSSSGKDKDKDIVYWSKETAISSGEGKEGEFQSDMTEVGEEIKWIKKGLNFDGGNIELKVIASVNYQGEIGNERINEWKEFPLVIKPSSSYYQVSSKPSNETVMKELIQKVLVSRSNSEKAILIAPPVILLLTIIGLAVTKVKYKPLTEGEIKELKKKREHERFKEQIAIGEYSGPDLSKKTINVQSLKDLIELAIDSDKRVIFDPKKQVYFVIDGDILFFYQLL